MRVVGLTCACSTDSARATGGLPSLLRLRLLVERLGLEAVRLVRL